jgi:predicted TPR repeat methyltransferase
MLRVRFPEQESGGPDEEAFEVTFGDGRVERFTLHDYGRVYAVPGLYEEVVQRMLGCATPDRIAALLREAATSVGRPPEEVRVLDVGSGNGVSGEALAAAGMRPVVGVDLEPAARPATLRDRPGLYDLVLTGDVAALGPDEVAAIRDLRPNALTLVGALGNDHVGNAAVRAAAALLEPDALVAYAYPLYEDEAPLRAALAQLGEVAELHRERYVHRRTASGGERVWEASVVRLSRPPEPPRGTATR